MQAASFSLPDQDGMIRNLSDFRGKWIIIYFYPKDDTPGCTKEACGFRDIHATFQEKNSVIIGISKDSPVSHKKFVEKFTLPFILLSDPSAETIKAYGAWGEKKFMGKSFQGILRKTYVINPSGNIVKIYEKVDPLIHAKEILADIALLS